MKVSLKSKHMRLPKLNKFAKKWGNGRDSPIYGLVKDNKGILAKSPEESLKNLCDAHFPGSKASKRTALSKTYKKRLRH